MRLEALLVGVLCLVSGPCLAKVVEYECQFPYERARGHGWIPQIVAIRDDQAKGEVTVFDPLIREFAGVPIPATRGDETKARSGFIWKLDMRAGGQSTKMQYRLTYYKDGRPARIEAIPGGYDNKFSGEGTCKVTSR